MPATPAGPTTVAGPSPGAPPEAVDDVHLGLSPLGRAADAARARIAVLPVPMHWPPAGRSFPAALDPVARLLSFFMAHVRLVPELWRRRDHDLVLVREFLTVPLLPVWLLIWPLRRRVAFLLNHNLQEAHRRPLERLVLRLLAGSGCRFGCLETTEGCRAIGLSTTPDRLLVLPHPLELTVPRRARRDRRPVVGVVGEMRGEKGVEPLLEVLAAERAAGRLQADLLLGCPDPAAAGRWRSAGFEVIGTARGSDYLAALDRCDVVVINYRRERYCWRASGVAADALSRRAAVVCPDLPVMRHQLSWPAPVGALFTSLDQVAPAIGRALDLRGELDAALETHAAARGVSALAARLDAFARGGLERVPT